jgi:hypothetical protein
LLAAEVVASAESVVLTLLTEEDLAAGLSFFTGSSCTAAAAAALVARLREVADVPVSLDALSDALDPLVVALLFSSSMDA